MILGDFTTMINTQTQSISPHRQHKRDVMIARILETAREIMRMDGVAALSMQELARRLDMRAPSLYHYFSSKMDIYDALFRLGFSLFGEQIANTLESAQTWQEELSRTTEIYMQFALQNPELYQLCFERPVPGFVPSNESMQISAHLLQQGYQRVAQLLPMMDTELTQQQVVDLMIAIMHGITALHLANEPHFPVGQGRFGSLIPVVMSVVDKAWAKR
jgi:AcrR family transcriptional regulator